MKKKWLVVGASVALIASLAVAGIATAQGDGKQAMTKVTVQLKWVTQAQFAGFYAAQANGYYKQAGLDVKIKVGGPDIVPEQVVLGGQAEFGVNWLPSLFSNREQGNDLVNIAQMYTRSGTTEVAFKKSGIDTMAKMKGKKYGVWIFGNEFEQQAALVKAGLDPKKDVTLVKQNFDMVAFLKGEIDAASAMTYNELAQVLETKNPETGKLYQLSDLNVFKMSALGTGMLQDQGSGQPGDGGQVPDGDVQGLGVLPRQREGVCRDRRQAGNRASEGPPGLADERGQRADLAEQARDRGHGPGAVHEDQLDRDEVRSDQEAGRHGLVPQRPREEGGRSAQGAGHRRDRQELQEGRRHPEGRRQVARPVVR
jgi:ABC-type amino acid transport substrate-binding protein